ncbi:hypothetical protein EDB87DRAFT_1598025 [Lactarius vividus]|nr:hypothetical protein EDB87DRAFT_1598025 [Lactarius vividus]
MLVYSPSFPRLWTRLWICGAAAAQRVGRSKISYHVILSRGPVRDFFPRLGRKRVSDRCQRRQHSLTKTNSVFYLHHDHP